MPKNNYKPFNYSKYGAQKVEVDGIKFDSKKEAKRYRELKFMEKAGEISALKLQVPFLLIPAAFESYERYGKKGQRLKDGSRRIFSAVNYVADFVYLDREGKRIVEDVKGFKTKEYIIKKKLLYNKYGILIKEV